MGVGLSGRSSGVYRALTDKTLLAEAVGNSYVFNFR